MSLPAPTFRIRNRFHEVEGNYTEAEILKRIESGRYRGDEEISPPPYLSWQKLSSHPLFYDAFLKRLYEGDYQSPGADGGGSSSEPEKVEPSERATRQADPKQNDLFELEPLADSPEEAGMEILKTRRVENGLPADFNATIHQSAIDALFKEDVSESRRTPPKPEPLPPENLGIEAPPPGTSLMRIDVPFDPGSGVPPAEAPSPDLKRPLDFHESVTEEEASEVVARKRAKDRRRLIVWASAAVLLLSLLFHMGQSSGGKDLVENGSPSATFMPEATRELINSTMSKADRVETLLAEARGLFNNDDRLSYRAAVESAREGLGLDESNTALLAVAAASLARQMPSAGNPDALQREISTYLKRGREADPTYGPFYRVEALVALAQNKYEDAKRLVGDSDEADPEDPENYVLMAEIAYRQKDPATAHRLLEQAVKSAPDNVRAHYLLAQISLDEKNYGLAKQEALQALTTNAFHPRSYFVMGCAAEESGDLASSRSFFETAAKLAPFASNEVAGNAYYRLGSLEAIAGQKDEAQTSYLLSYYYWPKGEDRFADQLKKKPSHKRLEEMAKATAYSRSYFESQGGGFARQNNFAQAFQFYQAAHLLDLRDPKGAVSLVKMGDALEKTAGSYQDFRRAMILYQRAIATNPSEPSGYISLGLLETQQYNLERGYKLLQEASALAPEEAEPYVALGKHFYKRQDYNEALTQFLKAAEIDRGNSEIFYYAGLLRLLGKKDGIRSAMASFEKAYVLDPQNYDALSEWLKLKTLNYEKNFAIKFLRNLIERDPRNPKLYWILGQVYATDKEFRRAISYFHASLDLDSKASKVRMSLAESLQAIGELDNAVTAYTTASQLDRRNSDGFFKAADLLFQMHKYKEAESTLKALVRVTPNYPGVHRSLSKVYQVYRQKDPAIEEMKIEVANNPQNAKFKVELAELYMSFEKYEDAVKVLTEISNLPPIKTAPEYLYDKIRGYLLLSRCYRMMGKPESSEASISLGLDLDPEDPELHRELGYVYYAEQRDQMAVKEFQMYLSRTPAAQDADNIKGLIQQLQIDSD